MAYHKLNDDVEPLDSLEGSENGISPPSYYRNKPQHQSRRLLRLSTANLILLALQFILLSLHVAANWSHDTEEHIHETYGFDSNYMTLSHDYDFLWNEAAVTSAGAIALSRDAAGDIAQYGVISMFHELHCLTAMRTALQKAHEGQYVAYDQSEDPHWPHCLHYLRQMILCRANDQIEHAQIWNDSSPFVNGATDMRQCKDTQPLFELFEEKGVVHHH